MTLEQLRAAYPGCPEAVEAHEKHMPDDIWEKARERGLTPQDVAGRLRDCVVLTLRIIPSGLLQAIQPQMNHPDFVRYVAAKLGAM